LVDWSGAMKNPENGARKKTDLIHWESTNNKTREGFFALNLGKVD